MNKILSLTRRCVEDYAMIQPGDKIAVGVSGGKDSLALLYAMAKLREFYPAPFELHAITIHPGPEEMDFSPVAALCAELGVEYHLIQTEIFHIIFDCRKEKNPCSMCAKMRRGAMHKALQELGISKAALGHHFDDVVETVLMSTLYGAEYRTMMPKLHSTNFPGMELIRPLYLVRERDILAWKNYNSLRFLQCACRFTADVAWGDQPGLSKRQEVKELIRRLRQDDPQVDINIFRSVHNVNLDTIIGWRSAAGGSRSFLDGYDTRTAGEED